jgi:hypothetical protein
VSDAKFILILVAAVLIPMLATSRAMATNNIHGNWEVFYGFADANPVDDSLTDAGSTECQLCHLDSNGGQPWNAYGFELHLNGVDFAAADLVDSDGDGDTNGEEIDYRDLDDYAAQPGWTSDMAAIPGNVECVDKGQNFGCSPLTIEQVPATAGPLEVPEPGILVQLISGGVGLAYLHKRRSRRSSLDRGSQRSSACH